MNANNGSQPPIAGLILVAVVMSSVFFIDPPLQGSRPEVSPSVEDIDSGNQRIPARLWQDPFEAIALSQPGSAGPSKTDESCRTGFAEIFNLEKSTQAKVLLIMTPASQHIEDGERRMRARYAVTSALGVAEIFPRDSQHIDCVESGVDQLAENLPYEWFDSSTAAGKSGEKPVLVVWLPEEKFAKKPLETLSGLVGELRDGWGVANTRSGDHLTVSLVGPHTSGTLLEMTRELRSKKKDGIDAPLSNLKRVRIFSPSATADESLFPGAKPGEDTASLYHQMVEDGQFIKTVLSDTQIAAALIKELERRGLDFRPLDGSPRISATWHRAAEGFFMADECKVFDRYRDHVVLIAERDTLFGRQFPEAFRAAFRQEADLKPSESTRWGNRERLEWIHSFSYLRGLDGKVPTKNDAGADSSSEKKSKSGTLAAEDIKRAAGTSRFDYLRRLGYSIKNLDHALRKNYCGSVKAIGILGSDVYDKLLILQALREKFPNALFFTADMDTRYLHPAEFSWTRNLIVASSLGLELDVSFKADTPPFRDSYQTSRFLATLFALGGQEKYDQKSINKMLEPVRIWEIGRNAPHDITVPDAGESFDMEPTVATLLNRAFKPQDGTMFAGKEKPESQSTKKVEVGAFETEVKLIAAEPLESTVVHRFQLVGGLLAFSLFALGAGYYVRGYFGLHPVSSIKVYFKALVLNVTEEGKIRRQLLTLILLWASYFVLGIINTELFLAAGALTVTVIILGKVSLGIQRLVFSALGSRISPLFSALLLVLMIHYLLHVLDGQAYFSTANGGEPFSLVDGISMWPGEIIRIVAGLLAVAFLAAGIRSLRTGDKDLTDDFYSSSKGRPNRQDKHRARTRRVDWCCGVDKDSAASKPAPDALTDWIHYRYYRSFAERWNSVVFPATLFFLLGCVLIYWVDDFHTPYRGEFVYSFDQSVIFGFMVPAFLLLLFTVIDETSLCVGWVRRLTREFTYNKPTSYFLSGTAGSSLMRDADERELNEIRARLDAVGRRTRRVGNLIVGPFIVLFIMLLSQSPYFDNWDIPFGLILTILISAAYAIVCAIKLRRVSEAARRAAVKALTNHLLKRGGKDDKIELILKEVKEMRDGGFLPWFHQPWLKAILWLLSAFGIMSTQYISLGALQ